MSGSDACLRCGEPLEPAELGKKVEFERCTGCAGLLVERPVLIPLLNALVDEVGKHVPAHGPLAPVPDTGGTVDCPECGKAMETFGYMETRTVFLDRCNRCALIWIDPPELQTMVMMHARVTQRAEAKEAELQELHDDLSRLVWIVNRPERGGFGF